MFIRILCLLLGLTFLTGGAYAQEKEKDFELKLAPMSLNVTGFCAKTEDFNKAQEKEQTVFMGVLNNFSFLKLSLADSGWWSITVNTANGLTCMYFGGSMGGVTNKPKKEEPRRKINGKHVYNQSSSN
jgi:hypothetical protein